MELTVNLTMYVGEDHPADSRARANVRKLMEIVGLKEAPKESTARQAEYISAAYLSDRLYSIHLGMDKIRTIKFVREVTGLGLMEAKAFVENLPSFQMTAFLYEEQAPPCSDGAESQNTFFEPNMLTHRSDDTEHVSLVD